MPQLEDVRIVIQRGDGADGVVIEVVAVGAGHQAVDLIVGKVDGEGLVDGRCALGVGQLGEGRDLLKGERGDVLGHIEAATLGQAVYDGLGEGNGGLAAAARVDVEVLAGFAG